MFILTLQTIQDWMLALIVLMFIAIDVIILLVYDVYSATQGTLEAIRLSNREKISEEIGVRGGITITSRNLIVVLCIVLPMNNIGTRNSL